MTEKKLSTDWPEIPDKKYFTIGEVSQLCDVKAHVLRYWEQEFPTLQPVKRAGNRRYFQKKDVLLVRHIATLLYQQGFTINGARAQLDAETVDQAGSKGSGGKIQVTPERARELRFMLEDVRRILE